MIRRVDKLWGEEMIFAPTSSHAGKLLRVRKGETPSLQYHERKDAIRLTIGDAGRLKERTLGPGEACHLPPGTCHRVEALEETTLFEISTPELDDVVRLRDRHGRIPPKPAPDGA